MAEFVINSRAASRPSYWGLRRETKIENVSSGTAIILFDQCTTVVFTKNVLPFFHFVAGWRHLKARVGQRWWNFKNPPNPLIFNGEFSLHRRSVFQIIFSKGLSSSKLILMYYVHLRDLNNKPYTQVWSTIMKTNNRRWFSFSLALEMGACSSTIYLPSPRTTVNRVLFWMSVKLHWKEIEISDHKRSTIKTTVTWDRQRTPAVSLRRRVRSRMNEDPNTIGVIWTSPGEMTTAITITMEHI